MWYKQVKCCDLFKLYSGSEDPELDTEQLVVDQSAPQFTEQIGIWGDIVSKVLLCFNIL